MKTRAGAPAGGRDTIAIVFDFDDTLAPDSTSAFLASLGLDVPAFWAERAQPLVEAGWDPIPAYLYLMIEESRARPSRERITRERLARFGRGLELYPGVTRIFGTLERHVRASHRGVDLRFFLVSSGVGELVRACRIASHFEDVWACDFHYDEHAGGEIVFPKNVVSFTDKTRFLFHISKGLWGPASRGKPFEVNRKLPDEHRIPLDQMVFVGDGYTDVPCFSLLKRAGGVAIGVYDQASRHKWGRAWGFIEDGRVSNLVPADYRARTALHDSLVMAIDAIARRIELRRSTYQG